MLNAPAYQFTTDWEDLNTHQKAREEGSVVRNEALQIEWVNSRGKDGIITDGKIEFVFFHGRYGKEPGDAAATLSDQLKNASLQSLLDESEEHTPFLGSEKVSGVAAELYALNALRHDAERVLTQGEIRLRVWVAKDDHRPLKVEIRRSYVDQQATNMTHADIQTRTYRYDPDVKVTLPGT